METTTDIATDTGTAAVDVAIAGGGLAGLAAAAYLARAGRCVVLFEKAAGLGGRAVSQRHDGFVFNRGIHALYTGGATSAVLRDLGVSYRHGIPRDIFALHDGRFAPLPQSPRTILGNPLLHAADALELLGLMIGLLRERPAALAHVSVQAWIDHTARRPAVRRILAAGARTFVYSAALDLVSAEVFVDKLQRSLRHPIHYVAGGWQTLVDGLAAAATRAGARLEPGTRVEGLLAADGRVTGVRLPDGRMVPAGAVLLALPAREAAALLEPVAAPAAAAIRAACVPAEIACLDVALRELPAARRPVVQDLDAPRFLSTQSRYAPIAPPDGVFVAAMKQLDPRVPGDARADEGDLEALLDVTHAGWREALVHRVTLPRITAVDALPLATRGGFTGRPASAVAGLAGCRLAGDWVGPEGFLADASLASARRAAQELLAEPTAPSRPARVPALAGAAR